MHALSSPRARRTVGVLVSLGLATVAIGMMHTHTGRHLLARLGVPCPVNQVDPQLVLAVRSNALVRARGEQLAPERPALNLRLDATTEEELSAWALRTQAHCDALTRGLRHLRCRGVPADALGIEGPAISEIWFSFGPDHTLTAVNLYRRGMTETETRQSWQAATQRLRTSLGAPAQSTGDLTLDGLASAPVAVARVRYRYRDYLASVTASHLPDGGLAVREQYMSAVTAIAASGPTL